jgi:uncharacterized protein with PQ loop repeat
MSRQNHILHFHISKKKQINWLDKIAIIAAFLYPLTGLPQVITVMKGDVDGVSIWSWLGFMVFSLFFLIYGSVHKIKPMIITNALWVIVDGLVVLGILMNRMLI